jgi:hypothetical protein
MNAQDISALLAVGLSTVNTMIYVRSVLKGKTKPHAFSWGIWSLLSLVMFAAQREGGGGVGALLQLYNGAACGGVALLGLKYGDRGYTRSDWAALAFALASIPLWRVTGTPLWSVLLLCGIDAAAFWPTFRKSWLKPGEEPVLPYIFWAFGALASLAALEAFNLITATYPVFLASINTVFVLMLVLRRSVWNR